MTTEIKTKKRVYLGLSGGVDSAVSAYMLVQQGYDVCAVFIQTWTPDWLECSWRQDRRDAMRVAIFLNIPYKDLDLRDVYKHSVAEYMIGEYKKGRTPNPDVMCNKAVKFGAFLDWALEQGADYVATGHYASTKNGNLYKGFDPAKDQCYFLWTLTKKQLSHILFPVGGQPKSETRILAEKSGLPVAKKPDSQGVCFLGHIDIKEFLSHYIEFKRGEVLDSTGTVIGYHDGALFLTPGQRGGFVIHTTVSQQEPLYVISRNIEKNTITVGKKELVQRISDKEYQGIKLENCLLRQVLHDTCLAQIRYHGEYFAVSSIEIISETEIKMFLHARELLSLGQSVVFYDGDICIGGGILTEC